MYSEVIENSMLMLTVFIEFPFPEKRFGTERSSPETTSVPNGNPGGRHIFHRNFDPSKLRLSRGDEGSVPKSGFGTEISSPSGPLSVPNAKIRYRNGFPETKFRLQEASKSVRYRTFDRGGGSF